ncbi:MAG: CHAD domain-containing protein [Thermoanaerobaculia bacterium]|nr:CHAD domain-containing protein [Thermoanaerobaculia bacterium]
MASPRSGTILGLLEETLAAQGEKLRALAARAGEGGDDELVHDVRVALRRLEAVVRLFRGIPGKEDGDEARETARTLRRRLSLLRSEEVGRALLSARAEAARGDLESLVFPEALPPVRVERRQVEDVERALARWRRRLASALDGAFAPRAGAGDLLVRKTLRRLRRRVSELSGLLPPGRRTLHPARIAAKRLRYALEVVEPLEPGARPLLRLLRSFQDEAGDAHDLVELAARVRAAAGAGPSPDARLGPLALELERAADRALASARRRGAILAGPVRKLRPALGGPESR